MNKATSATLVLIILIATFTAGYEVGYNTTQHEEQVLAAVEDLTRYLNSDCFEKEK